MPRRLVDISSPLKAGILSDPPHMLPKIEYMDHHQTAPAMAEYMGVRVDQLPNGEYAAVERAEISTHNGTHMDAPYHFFSSMNHALKPEGSRPGGSTRCRWTGASSQGSSWISVICRMAMSRPPVTSRRS